MTLNQEEIIEAQAKAMYELNFKGKEPTKYDVSWEDLKINHPNIAKILIDYAEAALDALLSKLPEISENANINGLHNYIKTLEGYMELWERLLSLKRE